MTFSKRELAELRHIYAEHMDPPGEVPLAEDGTILLNKVKPVAVVHAQNRAIGSMLDEVLKALRPKSQPRKKAKPVASPARRKAPAKRKAAGSR